MRRVVSALDALRDETESIVSDGLDEVRSTKPKRAWQRWSVPLRIAAALSFAAVGYLVLDRIYPGSSTPHVADRREQVASTSVATPPGDARFGVSLQGESAARYMAVNTETDRPDVQIVWLYPATSQPASENSS